MKCSVLLRQKEWPYVKRCANPGRVVLNGDKLTFALKYASLANGPGLICRMHNEQLNKAME